MQVRTAQSSDVARIVENNLRLALESERTVLDRAVLTRGVEAAIAEPARGRYFVADRNGSVVGQLMITTEWSDWRNGVWWWVQSVFVEPEVRGTGVVDALFGHVRHLARSEPDVLGLKLYVERDNARAQRAYERLGLDVARYVLFEEDLRRASERA
jgi:GNAT superfamily N-acetyltransferase